MSSAFEQYFSTVSSGFLAEEAINAERKAVAGALRGTKETKKTINEMHNYLTDLKTALGCGRVTEVFSIKEGNSVHNLAKTFPQNTGMWILPEEVLTCPVHQYNGDGNEVDPSKVMRLVVRFPANTLFEKLACRDNVCVLVWSMTESACSRMLA